MRLLVGLVTLALLGCGGSEIFIDRGPPDAALIGTWTLTTVNGATLPVAFVTTEGILNVEAGRLQLLGDVSGSLYFSDIRDSTTGAEVVQNGQLAYSRDGTRVSLTFVVGHTVLTQLGTLSDDTLTMTYASLTGVPNGTYVYVRP